MPSSHQQACRWTLHHHWLCFDIWVSLYTLSTEASFITRLAELKNVPTWWNKTSGSRPDGAVSLGAFTPADSVMRVHSVRTGLHNSRLRETEGCAQIYASAPLCINSLGTGLVFGEVRALPWVAQCIPSAFPVVRHTVGQCSLSRWSRELECQPWSGFTGTSAWCRPDLEALCTNSLPHAVSLHRLLLHTHPHDTLHTGTSSSVRASKAQTLFSRWKPSGLSGRARAEADISYTHWKLLTNHNRGSQLANQSTMSFIRKVLSQIGHSPESIY